MGKKYKVLISGGGTGGHIFPALAIAGALKERLDSEILFVGAENRMEMEKVPAAGYEIIGLPVEGFNRKNLFKNISVLFKLRKSINMARKIVADFQPDIAVGVGGYASGPTLKAAQRVGIPTLLQEQNSFAGVTNKLLAKKAKKICVAYTEMDRFFPAEKIIMTGNPIRKSLLKNVNKEDAIKQFGLSPEKPIVLVIGGSLGARTLNTALEDGIKKLVERDIQVIWQTGKNFGNRAEEATKDLNGVSVNTFITDMPSAYKAADLVVSRAGAGTISELQLLGKAAILVPSPNVAEDHQTKNAKALSNNGAALLISDDAAPLVLIDKIITTITDSELLESMSKHTKEMALEDSDNKIVDEIIKICENQPTTKA